MSVPMGIFGVAFMGTFLVPGGARFWRLRCRLAGRQEKVTLGHYPAHSLLVPRKWREECKEQFARGDSPVKAKRNEKAQKSGADTVAAFANRWKAEQVSKTVKDPRNVQRALDKDTIPLIGQKQSST